MHYNISPPFQNKWLKNDTNAEITESMSLEFKTKTGGIYNLYGDKEKDHSKLIIDFLQGRLRDAPIILSHVFRAQLCLASTVTQFCSFHPH